MVLLYNYNVVHVFSDPSTHFVNSTSVLSWATLVKTSGTSQYFQSTGSAHLLNIFISFRRSSEIVNLPS